MLFRAHQPMPIDQCLWFSCRYAPKRARQFSAFIGRRHESGLRVPPSLSSLCPTWGDSPRHLGLARGRGSKSFGDPLASSLKDAVGGHRRKCRSTPMKICFCPHPPHSRQVFPVYKTRVFIPSLETLPSPKPLPEHRIRARQQGLSSPLLDLGWTLETLPSSGYRRRASPLLRTPLYQRRNTTSFLGYSHFYLIKMDS